MGHARDAALRAEHTLVTGGAVPLWALDGWGIRHDSARSTMAPHGSWRPLRPVTSARTGYIAIGTCLFDLKPTGITRIRLSCLVTVLAV